jgi:general secretion pathway protein G
MKRQGEMMRRGEGKKGRRGEREQGKTAPRPFPCSLSPSLPLSLSSATGWTLIELVITMTVLAILSAGIIPMVKTAVRRQKEAQLRDSLRTMREAIKDFKRDTVGMQCTGGAALPGAAAGAPAGAAAGVPGQPGAVGPQVDPRSKVVIADCTLFGVDNILQYPPDLDSLIAGVSVVPRVQQVGAGGDVLHQEGDVTKSTGGLLANKKKVYLREIPVDPITGEKSWCYHTPFDAPDVCSEKTDSGIFDVTSKAEGTALDGTKYKDW